ncbi:hypothetical protein BESB_076300 [Besnoitia besnoiti]|uniref:RRM domain-containing protein n=1 Tax=Besnoitia besnoiti TaxID=94643 RepID=A0A2A9MCM5_BESBE|nr:hypothetical protein BESB_076300 [Besnoitia besnoiti]PFH33413.1 hypothetical protein BESB_076300 [Besnoitia besnoiti]
MEDDRSERGSSRGSRAGGRAPEMTGAEAKEAKERWGSYLFTFNISFVPSALAGKTLYVSNLPVHMTTADVRRIFEEVGDIRDCRIVSNPVTRESRGFAFVSFRDPSKISIAIEKLDGKVFPGDATKPLKVERAKRNRPHQPTPGYYKGPPGASVKYDKSGRLRPGFLPYYAVAPGASREFVPPGTRPLRARTRDSRAGAASAHARENGRCASRSPSRGRNGCGWLEFPPGAYAAGSRVDRDEALGGGGAGGGLGGAFPPHAPPHFGSLVASGRAGGQMPPGAGVLAGLGRSPLAPRRTDRARDARDARLPAFFGYGDGFPPLVSPPLLYGYYPEFGEPMMLHRDRDRDRVWSRGGAWACDGSGGYPREEDRPRDRRRDARGDEPYYDRRAGLPAGGYYDVKPEEDSAGRRSDYYRGSPTRYDADGGCRDKVTRDRSRSRDRDHGGRERWLSVSPSPRYRRSSRR